MPRFDRKMTSPSLWLEGLYSNVDKYDVFGNENNFQVKVLDTPTEVGNEIVFSGRIIDPRMAHEAFLPDPCDLTITSNPLIARAIANFHTIIIVRNAAELSETISRDDIVTAKFSPGQNGNKYDLQSGDFVKIFKKSEINSSTNNANCISLKDIDFSAGTSAGVLYGTVNIPFEDISDGQKSFYKGIEVANGRLPSDILASPWSVANDHYVPKDDRKGRPILFIQDLIESFIELCREYYDEYEEKIVINDSYRSYERQVQLDKTSKYAATPGYSNHGWGVAFDVNGTNVCKNGCPSSKSIERFTSPIYAFLDQQGAGRHGFINPPSMRYDGSLPESWHWENITVRNKVFDKKQPEADYIIPDGSELQTD